MKTAFLPVAKWLELGAICKCDESCVLEVTDEVVKQDKSQYGHLHTSLITGFQVGTQTPILKIRDITNQPHLPPGVKQDRPVVLRAHSAGAGAEELNKDLPEKDKRNLSILLAGWDLGSISTTVPKSMANSLWNTRAISYSGCAAQVFLVVFLLSAEHFLLTVMAYDRFVAICKPLHYGTIMGSRACVRMAAAAWASGFIYSLLHTGNTFSLPLCQGNAVDQFFCEIPQILKLSCADSYLREVGLIVVSVFLVFGCFIFIVLSYVQIFRAVLRILSEQGRHKAFSMCLPHLAVVSLFVSTTAFAYLKPPTISSPSLDLVVTVLYSVVPPTLNSLLYSMRNKELQEAKHKYPLCDPEAFCKGKGTAREGVSLSPGSPSHKEQ
ncbi:olfactory receptor 14C36-like [Rhea pennata]|uniref:olfactory receptor 14C36-like n=1 Tax=Rhea pennata TaxID=8795 RepID=UPI002E25AE2D